jgi:hypothetical protein
LTSGFADFGLRWTLLHMLWRQKGDRTYSLGAAAKAVADKARIEKMVEGCIFCFCLVENF